MESSYKKIHPGTWDIFNYSISSLAKAPPLNNQPIIDS